MLGADLGYRHRLAALVGLCLILTLTGVPAAAAYPILDEGDEYAPALTPSPGGLTTAHVAQTSPAGVDLSSVLLVAAVVLAAAIAATALILTAQRRPPVPATRF
jgi:hypothetical protein